MAVGAACVRALVTSEVGRLQEALAAVEALEGLLPRVRAHVAVQVRRLREALAALLAREGPLARVRALVAVERRQVREASPAERAREGTAASRGAVVRAAIPTASVTTNVLHVLCRQRKLLATLRTANTRHILCLCRSQRRWRLHW